MGGAGPPPGRVCEGVGSARCGADVRWGGRGAAGPASIRRAMCAGHVCGKGRRAREPLSRPVGGGWRPLGALGALVCGRRGGASSRELTSRRARGLARCGLAERRRGFVAVWRRSVGRRRRTKMTGSPALAGKAAWYSRILASFACVRGTALRLAGARAETRACARARGHRVERCSARCDVTRAPAAAHFLGHVGCLSLGRHLGEGDEVQRGVGGVGETH